MSIISKAKALAQNLLDIAWPDPAEDQAESDKSAWDARVRELREEAAFYRGRGSEAGGDMRGTF